MILVSEMFNIKGKVALVTGSSHGLGKGYATVLGKCGARIVINSHVDTGLEETANELKALGIETYISKFDITKTKEVEAAIGKIEKEFGEIDILVNNAGIQIRHPLEEFPEEDFDAIINTNLKGAFIVSKAIAPSMIKKKCGKIINICSLQSALGRETIAPYAAAKGGLQMFTKAMCVEWAKHNIQVNGIAPGYFDTEMTKALVENETFNSWLCGRTPANRWGKPEELHGALLLLASNASSFINGQVIYVDGGVLVSM